MYKRTETYTGFDGVERTEDFYFNLNQAEIMEMELGISGGMTDYLDKIVKAVDTPSIITVFKELLLKAYGEKSADGRRFVKSPELSKAFSETPVYEKMFIELATDAQKAADFVNAIIPKNMGEAVGGNKPAIPTLLPVNGGGTQ